jgi:hypothetical protein
VVYGLKRGYADERRAIDKGFPGKHVRAGERRSTVVSLPKETAGTRKANKTDGKNKSLPRANAVARVGEGGRIEKLH